MFLYDCLSLLCHNRENNTDPLNSGLDFHISVLKSKKLYPLLPPLGPSVTHYPFPFLYTQKRRTCISLFGGWLEAFFFFCKATTATTVAKLVPERIFHIWGLLSSSLVPEELTSAVRSLRIFNKYFHHPPSSRKIKQTNCALKFKLAKPPEAPNLPKIWHLVLVILKSFPFQATLIIPL